MTHLRQAMLEELQRRNYATTTVQYLHPGRRAIRQVLSHAAGPTQSEPRADVSGVPAARAEARAADGEAPRLGAPVLLREDTEAAVHAGRPAVSEGPTPAPGDPHHGRSHPIDRWGAEPDRSHDAHGRCTSTGMRNAELRHLQVRRHRQTAACSITAFGTGRAVAIRSVPLSARRTGDPAACPAAGCGRRHGLRHKIN